MNYEFNLDVTPGGMPPVLHMSQYDTDRTYSVSLYNGGAAVTLDPDATAKVKGVNGKGVAWEIDATVIHPTGLGNTTTVIEFALTAASTDQFGKTAATIEIDNDGAILSPLCLLFDIQKAGYTNEQAANSPEFQTAMEEAILPYAPFVVHITQNGQTYSADHYVADIIAAGERQVYAILGSYRLTFAGIDSGTAIFQQIDTSGGGATLNEWFVGTSSVTLVSKTL